MAESGFLAHSHLVLRTGWGEAWDRLTEWLNQEALLVVATGVVSYFWSPGTRWERLLVAILIPLAGLVLWIICLLIWKLSVAPSTIFRKQEVAITTLRRDLAAARGLHKVELAEEDPKVHIEPLNSEFATAGIVPFDLSNLGQRVNPAYGIRLSIPIVPSISFDYVNVLEMGQHKRTVPTVEDCENILSQHNILPVLDKAWTSAKGISDSDEAWKDLELEFPFDMKAIYQDASGNRSFETIVSLTYCPLDAHAARRGSTFRQREYAILKVTDVKVRRVA